MAGFIWLLGLGTCAVAGIPLLQHSEFRRFGLLGRGLLAAAVGAVCLSWAMTLVALLGLRWHPVTLVALALLAGLCLRLILANRPVPLASPPIAERLGLTGLLGAALGTGIVVVAILATRAGQTMSPDLLYFWGPKAQRFAEVRTIDASFLRNPLLDYIPTDYPPLLTNLYAFATMVAGSFSWWAAAAVFPVLLAATGIAVAAILASEKSRTCVSPYAGLMTCALGVVGIQAMVAGVAEMPLLFFEMLAVSLLILAKPPTSGLLLLAGLCLAGAAGTKVEGLPFALAVSLLFAFVIHARGRRVHALAFLLIPTLITLGTWFLFGAKNGLFWFYRGYGSLLAVRWGDLPLVAAEILRSIGKVSYGLPFLLPLIIFILTPGKTRAAVLPIAVSIALIGFLLATYLSTRGDPRELIGWSSARVLSPVAGLFCLAASRRTSPVVLP
jgi:hypothetical protein